MWVNMQGPLLHDFSGLPQVKNQHLTVLNKRRRLEWCTSMLERLGEPKRLWDLSRKTHISRGFEVIVLLVPSRTSDSGSFGYLVLSVTHLPANSLDGHHVLVVALMFTADHPWRRRTSKQSGFSPELQLRDVVWSDESSFRRRDKDRRAWR